MLRVSYKELFYFIPSLPQKEDTDDKFLITLIIAACMSLINKRENKRKILSLLEVQKI